MNIRELDVIALTAPLPDAEMFDGSDGLHIGDRGTVVGVWRENVAYIVEFFRDGETVAIEDVTSSQVRLVWQHNSATQYKTVNA
ncbi:MAG: DUF4926 domain-containing protein [Chloroflexota bacterium]|nr:DUF4926 domain-containing protein [Chloroflexota bacterium]